MKLTFNTTKDKQFSENIHKMFSKNKYVIYNITPKGKGTVTVNYAKAS